MTSPEQTALAAPSAAIRGHLDGYVNECVSGWALDAADLEARVRVEVEHLGRILFTVLADRFRPDLLAAGHGDGCCAFEIPVPLSMFAEPLIVLQVRAGGVELTNSPIRLLNPQPQLAVPVLERLAGAISLEAKHAVADRDLAGLSTWLLTQYDKVFQRRVSLAQAAQARRDVHQAVIRGGGSLSDSLRQAAAAVLEHYAALELPAMGEPEVSVIIPACNHFDVTYRCLVSICRHLPAVSFEVVLVDDGSIDATRYAGMVLGRGFHVVHESCNVGFVHAVEAGVAKACGRLLFFLNNDCEVHEGWLDRLVQTVAAEGRIGIVGSKLLDADGRLQEAGGIIWRRADGMNYGRGHSPDHPRYCFMRDADYVSGAGLLISRRVYDAVGGLSPEFAPGYYEDADLCFKVRAAGFRVVVQPLSLLTHYEGVTAGRDVCGPGMKRFQEVNRAKFLQKWSAVLQGHGRGDDTDPRLESERDVVRRLLFIDTSVPTPDRDAGSNAALEHMRGLQRIGFKVSFVGADNMARISPYTEALEALGIENYYAPHFSSVEEIIRHSIAAFDVVYIHRCSNAVKYLPTVRAWCPSAWIVYNVSDLHHIRLGREAVVKADDAIRREAEVARRHELQMAAAADSVIVHSTFEAAALREAVPGAAVHVVPWSLRVQPVTMPFAARNGVAFVGGYNHTPNVDAAEWLVNEIMALVWAEEPEVECLLIGSDMPLCVRQLVRPRVRVLGHMAELGQAVDGVRLMVAPLRFGAGIKGKVLTSLSMGLPCVMTPCAAEGLALPAVFGAVTATRAGEFARAIVRVHGDEALNGAVSKAGLAFITEHCGEDAVDARLRAAVERKSLGGVARRVPGPSRSAGASQRRGLNGGGRDAGGGGVRG